MLSVWPQNETDNVSLAKSQRTRLRREEERELPLLAGQTMRRRFGKLLERVTRIVWNGLYAVHASTFSSEFPSFHA